MTFTSAYVPQYSSNFAKDICKLTPKNRNFVVLGDFNAKHVAWNCLANNRAGNVLFNMLHKADFVMHHPDTFTHHPHCGSTPSVIDFALTNSPIIYSNVYTLDGALPSDHNPVIYHIQGTPPETMPNARPNYKKANWDKFRGEALADQFLENHSLTVNFRHSIDKQVKNSVDSINRTEPCITQTSSHHVNLDEIKKIIYKLKIKKSPGLDGIANILLKRLPETAVIYLTTIINKCVDLCYFPKQFKMAKVISTLKPTKDPKNSSSYRPISLLSSVGQIYETI